MNYPYCRPISARQLEIFSDIHQLALEIDKPVILDSGCGRGDSTFHLAELYPDHLVIGIDKSAKRLEKCPKNAYCFRAELLDFWRLCIQFNWKITKHYILYPNPWPKSKHIQRRFHGHPIFPTLLKLSPDIQIRSNWKLYLEEFEFAAKTLNPNLHSSLLPCPYEGISQFETRYERIHEPIYQLKLERD